ncbi:YhhN-like_protein [Hexamita inflata]|uniref:YhhN-like protein n=1 Tax=Hexamita inflata TaxID=28002 RepID=A0AA86PC61_9EUKA|nr:YhhN-like protein [Hexamita inflata]
MLKKIYCLIQTLLFAVLIYYRFSYPASFIQYCTAKFLMSGSFFIIGLQQNQPLKMKLSLLFYAFGDVFIMYSAILGALSFSIGHLFCVLASKRISIMKLITGFIASLPLPYYIYQQGKYEMSFIYQLIFYLFSCAMPFVCYFGQKGGMAAILFFVSDHLIILDDYISERRWQQVTLLGTYYIAVNYYAMMKQE